MKSSRRALLVVLALGLSSILIVAYARKRQQPKYPPLAIELALSKPFYVPAAVVGKHTMIVIRVPIEKSGVQSQDAVSAVKLEPTMENEKVSVLVSVLRGNADTFMHCSDWDALQATKVGTYVAGVNEDVSLSALQDYGVSFGKDPLTYRVVPRRGFSPTPQHDPLEGDGCDCASCGGLMCCPNPGFCLGCNPCGQVCCQAGGGGS